MSPSSFTFFRRLGTTLLSVAVTLVSTAEAQELSVPIQAALFKKILSYDRAITGAPKVVVLYADESAAADTVRGMLQKTGLEASTAKLADAAKALEGASAAYLFPHAATAPVLELCAKAKVLTLTGAADLVREKKAAIGLSILDGRPHIVVNLPLMKAEAHDLASDLLNLAEIVK